MFSHAKVTIYRKAKNTHKQFPYKNNPKFSPNVLFLYKTVAFRLFGQSKKYRIIVMKVRVLDKVFQETISEKEIQQRVAQLAKQMNEDLAGKNPLFVCILNGAFMFASDLFKQITVENAAITFFRLASYEGTTTTGKVKKIMGFTEKLKDRTVVVIEDVVDTGITIKSTIEQILEHEPEEVRVATCIFKPDSCIEKVKLDYVGFEMPNDFIVGYGLDYDAIGRNFPAIYTLCNE